MSGKYGKLFGKIYLWKYMVKLFTHDRKNTLVGYSCVKVLTNSYCRFFCYYAAAMMLAPIYIFPEKANRACKSKVNISQYRINAKDDWFYSSKSGPKMKDPQVIFCVNTCICCHFISLVGRKYLFQVVRNLDESFTEMLKWKEEVAALICHRRVSTGNFS